MPEQEQEAPAHAMRPVEEWARLKGTPEWVWRGAFVGQRWAAGLELTEVDYDAAIDAAMTMEIR